MELCCLLVMSSALPDGDGDVSKHEVQEEPEPSSAEDNGQCGSSAYSFCCAVGTPCDCSKGVTAEGQCSGSIHGLTSYAYCCSFGTPCDCSKPPTFEINGTLLLAGDESSALPDGDVSSHEVL